MPENLEKYQDATKCPIRNVLARFGDKWSVLILLLLGEETMRFNQLQRQIGEISQKMLSATLKRLEADGLIARKLYPEVPPKVEYSLTELGESLLPHLRQLTLWSMEHMEAILDSRKAFEGAEALG